MLLTRQISATQQSRQGLLLALPSSSEEERVLGEELSVALYTVRYQVFDVCLASASSEAAGLARKPCMQVHPAAAAESLKEGLYAWNN